MISEGAGSIMNFFNYESMKDPIFLQFFLLSLSKSAILKIFNCASKRSVRTLANDIYLQSAKFENIL